MEIDWTLVTKTKKTRDCDEVNQLLKEGWKLADVTRGNLDHSFLLVRMD